MHLNFSTQTHVFYAYLSTPFPESWKLARGQVWEGPVSGVDEAHCRIQDDPAVLATCLGPRELDLHGRLWLHH